MEQFNTIPTSGNWADIAGILDANFLRCYTALVQSQSLIGLDGSNYMGMYPSASALPEMTEAGWALVGSSLSALQLYVFNDGATDWALFSNETYNFTSWTEFQTQLDALSTQVTQIGLKLGDLTQLETEEKTNLVDAINEVATKADNADGGIYNLIEKGHSTAMSLAAAIQHIPTDKYAVGLHIIFNESNAGVVEYQFIGSSTSMIANVDYWEQILKSPAEKPMVDLLSQLPASVAYFINASNVWATRSGQQAYFIDLSGYVGRTVVVKARTSGSYVSTIAFLTSDSHVAGDAPAFDTTMNTAKIELAVGSDAVSYVIPATSKYLWVNGSYSSNSFLPSALYIESAEVDTYVKSSELEAAVEETVDAMVDVTGGTSFQNSDLDIVDEGGNVLARFANGHIKTKNFDSSSLNATSQAEYRIPLKTHAVDVTKPQHIGQINVQRKVEILCGLVWTPIRPMPSTSIGFTSDGTEDTNVVAGRKYFYANTPITGIPYSSTGISGKAIGCDITIETYMTALKNPNSVLYTIDLRDTLSSALTGSYYGSNCSSFTNYIQGIYSICKGRNNNYAANRILRSPKNADALQIGDVIYLQKAVIDSGHAVIVYRIDKDENGYITRIYEAEEDAKKANTYNYTKSQFVNRFFKGGYGYIYGDTYRNVDLVDNEYVESFDDSTYVYSDVVGLNLGNNTNYDKADNMPIEVTMLSSVGFSVILDGTTIATYSASDGVAGWGSTRIVTLDKSSLATGTYEVRPTSGVSQYFHLCDSGTATAASDRNGNLTITATGYSSNVTPYGVLFVSSRDSRTTRGLYLIDGASSVTIPADWIDFINTTNDIAYASVVYRNEYGNIYSELITI